MGRGRRNRGAKGHEPPLFKDLGKVPFSSSLVALLENFENTAMNKKIHISGGFRSYKLKNSPGKHAP